jgi:hypothetical protein
MKRLCDPSDGVHGHCGCGEPPYRPPCSFCTRGLPAGRIVYVDKNPYDYGMVIEEENDTLTVLWADGQADKIEDDGGTVHDFVVLPTAAVLGPADADLWHLRWYELTEQWEQKGGEPPRNIVAELLGIASLAIDAEREAAKKQKDAPVGL